MEGGFHLHIATALDRPLALDYEALLAPLYPALVRRLTLVIGDAEEAKDVAQATYLRAYQSWHQFDGRDARAWLYTIGLRLAFREKRRRLRFAALTRSGSGTEPWAPAHDSELWHAISALRRQERAALLLNIVDGYTQAEIGAMLAVPEGTVASWVSRAKKQLREQLGKE